MKNMPNEHTLNLTTPAAVKQGDHTAFLTVYNQLHIKVFRFFFKKVNNREDAKDLTQQCFIRLWQFRHTLSEQHTLDKQVFVIAHSLLVNHFEKLYRRKKIIRQKALDIPETTVAENMQQAFELSNHVSAAIDRLPPVRKKILILKTFHEYSNKEIAHQMEISVKTVEDHITKAFRMMKEILVLLPLLGFISMF